MTARPEVTPQTPGSARATGSYSPDPGSDCATGSDSPDPGSDCATGSQEMVPLNCFIAQWNN